MHGKIPPNSRRLDTLFAQVDTRSSAPTASASSAAQASSEPSHSAQPARALPGTPGASTPNFKPQALPSRSNRYRPDFQGLPASRSNQSVRGSIQSPSLSAAQPPEGSLTAHASLPSASLPSPDKVSTPGRVSASADPFNHLMNDIHTFPVGLTTYRGDNSFNGKQVNHYSAQFFTLNNEVSAQYGALKLEFKLQREINVLRLDQNAEGFHHWLKNASKYDQDEINILYENFGYPKNASENQNSNSQQGRIRVSRAPKDRIMLDMIQSYARATNQVIDGYYNSTMVNGDLGKLRTEKGDKAIFHAELAVYDGTVFDKPTMISQQSPETVRSLNLEARLLRQQVDEQQSRVAKKRKLNPDGWLRGT